MAICNRTRYCAQKGEPDSYKAILKCSKGTCMAFLKFILDKYQVPKYSSMQQYWRQFKMLFSRCNGYRMNTNAAYEVTKVRNRTHPEGTGSH